MAHYIVRRDRTIVEQIVVTAATPAEAAAAADDMANGFWDELPDVGEAKWPFEVDELDGDNIGANIAHRYLIARPRSSEYILDDEYEAAKAHFGAEGASRRMA